METLPHPEGEVAPDTRLFALKRPDSFLGEFRAKLGFHFRFHDLRQYADSRIMPNPARGLFRPLRLAVLSVLF
jgi:hypothetical protein